MNGGLNPVYDRLSYASGERSVFYRMVGEVLSERG
jgi:hypothetical protein